MDGKLHYHEEPESDYSYLFIPDNTGKKPIYFDMYKRPMKKVMFDSVWDMRDYAKTSSVTHESDVPLVYKFILDNYENAEKDAPCNIAFYDIEVDFDLDDGRGYPSIYNPFGPINGISLFDNNKKRYIMLCLTAAELDLKDDSFPVDVCRFLSERELLSYFCDTLEINDIDLITGWNTAQFDLNYIMERLIVNFGEKKAKFMMCRNKHEASKRSYTNEYGEDTWAWELRGRIHLDMMELYKKFKPKGLESYSLDSVCQKELGISKIEYDGNLGELYRENPQKFFDYSLHDSRLLYLLNKKLNIIGIALIFSRDNCVLAADVTGTVKPIEQAFIKFCRRKNNIVLPDKISHDKLDFRGAVVYDTICGLYKKTFSIDLTSLYPSCMIMLGLSIENIIFQLLGEDIDFYKVMQRTADLVTIIMEENKEEMTLPAYEIDDIIRENGFCISAAGTVFDGSTGLLAEFIKEGFDLRTKFKQDAKAADKRGDKDAAVKFDLLQNSKKLLNNSTYGAISNPHFRLFDIRLARSITYTGAMVSKHMNYRTNESLRAVA
jgi:DNA polymerase elongation subunit (family B)